MQEPEQQYVSMQSRPHPLWPQCWRHNPEMVFSACSFSSGLKGARLRVTESTRNFSDARFSISGGSYTVTWNALLKHSFRVVINKNKINCQLLYKWTRRQRCLNLQSLRKVLTLWTIAYLSLWHWQRSLNTVQFNVMMLLSIKNCTQTTENQCVWLILEETSIKPTA